MKQTPAWFADLEMSPTLRARLMATFSLHRDGYVRWHDGKTIFVCGKRTPPDRVELAWSEKLAELNRKTQPAGTIADACTRFEVYLQQRVTTGKPKPMAEATAQDYRITIKELARRARKRTPLNELGQEFFGAWGRDLAVYAPSTIARTVAYVRGFFSFCVDEGLLDRHPAYGRFFARPPAQSMADHRLRQQKSYTPEDIARLIRKANPVERLWIALALNGALDNADLANLPMPERGGVLDLEDGILDYRRRKSGRIRRVIPMRPETIRLIQHYLQRHRPKAADPKDERLLLLTPSGLPLQRLKTSTRGKASNIDFVGNRWYLLTKKAGLRVVKGNSRKPGSEGGNGFRGLRTTVANLVPSAYRFELEVIMGHQPPGVLTRNYLEDVDRERLRQLVDHVWSVSLEHLRARPARCQPAKAASAAAGS